MGRAKRMKLSRVFSMAKANLPFNGSARSVYICDTIGTLVREGLIHNFDGDRAKRHISVLLEGRFSLADWLHEKGFMSDEDFESLNTMGRLSPLLKKLQATRHAWLEHLIAHYRAIGD